MPKYCDIRKLVADTRAGRWWEKTDHVKKGGQKWKTMRHNGILFPDPYEPLPSNIRVKYSGKSVKLDAKNRNNPFNVTAEEAAVFFAMKLEQDRRLKAKRADKKGVMQDAVFKKNFWTDWKKILGSGHTIKSLDKVDFTPVMDFIVQRSEQKKLARKAMTKEEKEEEKRQKEAVKDLYGYAVVDGVLIPIGSYMVQPPGLFIGHGKAPRRGKIKARTKPQDVILNVSLTHVPRCISHGKPCNWQEAVENKDVEWIATYRHPITKKMNYVWLQREESHWVCMDDKIKFDKARKLEKNIAKIRKQYKRDLSSPKVNVRQLATAVYLLDELAIRTGMDKDESKEAGTLGLTTLKCGNITFKARNTVTINFMGKSSIKFIRTVVINSKAYANMKKLCGSSRTKALFPRVNASSLNAYLKTLLPSLTAKVFRHWKASTILQEYLVSNVPNPRTETYEKKMVYNNVNIEVAKALNHKRMVDNQEKVKKLEKKLAEFTAKKKAAKTAAAKARAQKSITLHRGKLEEARHNISTSTSKVNYLDPRITVAWAKAAEMPIEKLYNPKQLQKFVWAMETPENWRF